MLSATKFTGHWDRYEVVRRELLDSADYVIWMDADAMVKEVDLDLRQVIEAAGDEIDIIIGSDWEYNEKARPFPPVNTGFMVFRNSTWTLDFLEGFLALENDYCRRCAEK